MSWKALYSDDLSTGPYTLERLFERHSAEDTYNALKLILDKAPRFFQEYYQLVPNYEDGLSFVDFALDILTPYKRKIPAERFARWNICLITLKLEMLEKLGYWDEYRDYFNKIYALHPKFLSVLIPRYKAIVRHLKSPKMNLMKHSPPDIDEQTIVRNYRLLAERLDMLLKQDVDTLRLYL
jgi:tetratricopeptide (TPR) repeat protein